MQVRCSRPIVTLAVVVLVLAGVHAAGCRAAEPSAAGEFRLVGDGIDQAYSYGEGGLVLCTRDAGFADLWIRLAADSADNGEAGPHLDLDVCNLGDGGSFGPRDPRSPRCEAGKSWDVWWHPGDGSFIANDPAASDCELSLEADGEWLTGNFRCDRLLADGDGRVISLAEGELHCRIR